MCFNRRRIPRHLLLQPSPPYRPARRLWKWVLGFLVVLLTIAAAEVTRAELDPEQARAGSLLFKTPQGYHAALHHHSEAHVTINGLLARVVLRQTFENVTDEWVEGVYVFPLPEDAAVNRMVMEIGARRILGEIKEKQEAQRIYDQARRAGKRAALTRQERPNLFTQAIANIGPQEKVVIELQYHELVSYRDQTFSWRLPTTLTPRYIPGTPGAIQQEADTPVVLDNNSGWGWAQPTDQVPDAHRITPFVHPSPLPDTNTIAINISLNAGVPLARIHGSYHELSIYKLGQGHQITPTQKAIPMDRDFELQWDTVAGKAPAAAFFTEQVDGEEYALLMILPPQQNAGGPALPREVVFIIDTSGSMSGVSIEQAKASLQLALSRLTDRDRFNVIEFNSYHQALFPRPVPADSRALQQAQSFVQRLNAEGGTEMAPALEEALRYPAAEGYLKQVIFITDGSVGNEAALFELIHQQLGEARLFTVGIGSAPNSYFMSKAAEFGRGTFTFIGAQVEIAAKMQSLFTKLESPVMSDIDIHWPVPVEAWPARIPDLYQGEPLLISAKVKPAQADEASTGSAVGEGAVQGKARGQSTTARGQKSTAAAWPSRATIAVRGQQAGQSWSRKLVVGDSSSSALPSGIAARWAEQKIAALLDEKVRGRPELEVREAVLAVALQHQLMSPYTSFVAVEDLPSRPLDQTVAQAPVPNLLPQGQQTTPLMYPRTATSLLLNWLIGSGALLALLVLHRRGTARSTTCRFISPKGGAQ